MGATAFIPVLILFIIIFSSENEKKKAMIKKVILKNNKEMKAQMVELAKRFIGKECWVYTFNSTEVGVIKEVSDGALLMEKKGALEAINFDFVIKIQEYPKNKKERKK